jgi:EmrB/QacA subfamily drug resistance transporter
MDTTIVSVILAQLQQVFHTDVQTINWVVSAYFLAQAAVIPIVGYLSDRIGSKRVYLAVLALFITGSLLCGLSSTKEELIAFRVLQGLGGGALLPMAMAINYRIFPVKERSKLTAIISIPILMAPTFGPTIGGYLSTSFDWNAVFFINVPFGIVALVLAFLILPGRQSDQSEQTKRAEKSLDIPGLVLAIVGVTALIYGVSRAGSQGWQDLTVLTAILIGVVILIIFVVVELRVSDPVLNLRLFTDYTFTITNVLIWFGIGVFTGGVFLIPLFLENVQGYTALDTGQALIGQGLGLAVGMSVSGQLYNRVGPRILTVSGLLLMVGSTYGLTQIDIHTTGQALQVWLILRAFGLGFVYQPTQTLALAVVSNKGMARASSLVSTARQVATATAVAALTTYMTQQATTHATDISQALQTGLQTHNLTGVAAICAQAAGPSQNLAALKTCVGQAALSAGVADTFWVSLFLCAACIPLALVIRHDPVKAVLKQTKEAKTPDAVAVGASPMVQVKTIPNVISALTDGGEEILGPEILLWHYPKDNVVDGSLLAVESNHFCVLKSLGTILNVYETGQHILQTPDHPVQLAFSGERISWQYEVIYINRARLVGKACGVALSCEMAEVDYHVDYYIHVATGEDAVQLVQYMPYSGHELNMQDISAYAEPVIEQAVNQVVHITPLAQLQELPLRNLSQLVHQRLQQFLSNYGLTLGELHVLVSPRDELTKSLLSLRAFGLSELDVVRSYMTMTNKEQNRELEQKLSVLWRETLDRYAGEIAAIQSELGSTYADLSRHVDTHYTYLSARLQELLHAISEDLRASTPTLGITPLPDAAPHSEHWIAGSNGQFKVIDRSVPMAMEKV